MKWLVVFALFGLAAASLHTQFHAWMEEHGKQYSTPSELRYRFRVWSQAVAEVERFNAEGHSWKKGINKFSDLTEEEFASQYLMQPRAGVAGAGSNITQTIDWVAKGAVTGVKNQRQCGSCWAFGTVGSIEGCYQLKGNPLTAFSEQQLVDCVSGIKYSCSGCDGGLESGAMQWMIDNNVGLELESDYPYTTIVKAGVCNQTKSLYKAFITAKTGLSTESALQKAVMNQPVDVGINAMKLSSYASGIYCPDQCSPELIDHAVLVVGMNAAENSYTIKNSWGDTWGENGFFRMCGGANECGVGSDAVYPTCK